MECLQLSTDHTTAPALWSTSALGFSAQLLLTLII